ncbi:alpha-beta hydrolase superfamily lysophospholipase [Catenulispora sp. GP43]|uniref:alpha/beta hydrolase n=1 Tax=Catenulispora sp. GP43 TaxID=3156263 RepID=UPI003513B037
MNSEPHPETVVLIGGTCVTTLDWQGWMSRYTARGYSVIATGAPLPPSADCVGPRDWAQVASVVTYYERLLLTVPQPPVLIGHCFGGVIVQLLLDRGYGVAGVAVNPPRIPERRVRGRVFTGARPSRRADPLTIDYRSSLRAPLLLVGSGADRSVPPDSVEATARRYWKSEAVTSYLEYPAGCHHTLSAPGWESVADDVLDWAELYADPGRLTSADLWNR